MKKLFLIAVAMLATLSVSAQSAPGTVSLKPMVGMTLANFRGSDIEDTKMKLGLVAGGEAIFQLSDMFAVSGGLLYSMQGCKYDGHHDEKMEMEYLNVPLLANIYIVKGLALKAGVQLGLLTKAKVSASEGGVSGDLDIKDHCKSLDLSIPVGIGYEINNSFVIDARYNFGLSKIYKESDAKVYNSVFMVTLGYKFDM